MNLHKKIHPNHVLLVSATIIIIVIAFLRHPSLKPMLSFNSQQTWNSLISNLESGPENEAQEIWIFREFFSRGTIYLSKYQELDVPSEISENFSVPESFDQQMSFVSGKVLGVEGTIDSTQKVFFNDEDLKGTGWEIYLQTENVQILEREKKEAYIIGVFDMQTASEANGYLHFDYRDDDFKQANQNKKWLVVDYVQI